MISKEKLVQIPKDHKNILDNYNIQELSLMNQNALSLLKDESDIDLRRSLYLASISICEAMEMKTSDPIKSRSFKYSRYLALKRAAIEFNEESKQDFNCEEIVNEFVLLQSGIDRNKLGNNILLEQNTDDLYILRNIKLYLKILADLKDNGVIKVMPNEFTDWYKIVDILP